MQFIFARIYRTTKESANWRKWRAKRKIQLLKNWSPPRFTIKTFTTQKNSKQQSMGFEKAWRQKQMMFADNQLEIVRLLEEIRREQVSVNAVQTSLLDEIYCMAHTAVSLIRNRLVAKYSEWQEKMCRHRRRFLDSFRWKPAIWRLPEAFKIWKRLILITKSKTKSFTSGNLFWRSKLSPTDSLREAE